MISEGARVVVANRDGEDAAQLASSLGEIVGAIEVDVTSRDDSERTALAAWEQNQALRTLESVLAEFD